VNFDAPNYTPTPNVLFDELLPELSGAELKVVLYLIRRTFGFHRATDSVSLTQFCEGITTRDGRRLDHGTGLARSSASKALAALEQRGLIVAERAEQQHGGAAVNLYRLNLPSSEPQIDEPRVVRKSNQGSTKIEPGVVRKSYPQYKGSNTKVTKAAAATRAQEPKNSESDDPQAAAAPSIQRETEKPVVVPRRSAPARQEAPPRPAPSPAIPDGVKLIDAEPAALEKLSPEEILARFRVEHPDRWGKVEKIGTRDGVNFPRMVQRKEVLAILAELRHQRKRDAEKKPTGPKSPAPWEVAAPLQSMAARKRQTAAQAAGAA
jgi:DNA-binding transcriptional ArsR family regulator